MTHLKLDYIELQSPVLAESTAFFAKAFDWTFNDYGPDYQEIANGGVSGGICTPDAEQEPPLVILRAEDLEAAEAAVRDAGGEIVRDIFSFPGGRRFHFREPGGNVLGVWGET